MKRLYYPFYLVGVGFLWACVGVFKFIDWLDKQGEDDLFEFLSWFGILLVTIVVAIFVFCK